MADKNEKLGELEWHRKIAAQLFNRTWDLIDKGDDRTDEENNEMIHSVHASRYHWMVVIKSGKYPDAGPVNYVRGEWQISRVYSLLKRPHAALYHAEQSLSICQNNNIGDLDLAFSYEALARAYSNFGNKIPEVKKYLNLAKAAGDKIVKEDDKKYFFGELDSLSS